MPRQSLEVETCKKNQKSSTHVLNPVGSLGGVTCWIRKLTKPVLHVLLRYGVHARPCYGLPCSILVLIEHVKKAHTSQVVVFQMISSPMTSEERVFHVTERPRLQL